jgi:hypothetical protein
VIGNEAIIGWERTAYVLGVPTVGPVGAVLYARDAGTPGADLDRLQVDRNYSPRPPTVCPTTFPPSAPCPVGSPGEFDRLCNISGGEIAVHDTAADSDPPETRITKGAPNRLDRSRVRFRFTSDEPHSTFKCKIDRKPFKSCTSPRTVKRLDAGRHRFKVVAIDAAGNADPAPAKDRFKVVESDPPS